MKDIIKKEENLVIYELINLAPFLTFIFHKKKKIFLYFFYLLYMSRFKFRSSPFSLIIYDLIVIFSLLFPLFV